MGLGVMGTAILTRLLETGHQVAAYDVNPDAVARAVEAGATAAATPMDAAAGGVVILSLPNAAIVESAAFGGGGAATGPVDTLVIDMSSIDPNATARLAARAAESGHAWVDAPLSGGAPAALAGTLTLMLGGEDADVARARDVLAPLASRIWCGKAKKNGVDSLILKAVISSAFVSRKRSWARIPSWKHPGSISSRMMILTKEC